VSTWHRAWWPLWIGLVFASLAVAQDCAEPGWQTLGPGVHVWQPAPDQEASPANGGHVMPTSVLVHEGRAWVIDPGPSLAAGARVQAQVACRWQARVERVFNTHAHAENVLANGAFASGVASGEVGIWATAATREAMAQRCPACLADLTARVGAAKMAGTEALLPNALLASGDRLELGPHALRVHEVRDAHTHSDLVLVHETLQLAWVGGLVYGARVPELAQGSLRGWREALADLAQTPWHALVGATVSVAASPGTLPDALGQTADYLRLLQTTVLDAMASGAQAHELPTEAPAPYRSWSGHTPRHGFNLQRAWRELEPLWMDGTLAPEASGPDVGR
jgi:glyoxylase-like metal-dependent hydrolase (beta-lactamase superfamily II)